MTTTVLQPKVDIAILNASLTVENTQQKILMIGQKTSAGSAIAGALIPSIANGGAEDDLFGPNAMLSAFVRACKIRNQQVQIDAICLDDNGTTFATGATDFSGTATEDGVFEVIVASEKNHLFTIPVSKDDTATVIGAAIVTAITADPNVPVSAVNTTGSVAMTAVNAGTYGNSIPLEIRGIVAGITTSTTAMSGGALDPVLTTVFDVIPDKRYQGILWPYPNDTTEVRSLLDPRFNSGGKILDGCAFTALADTVANLKTLGDGLNSRNLVIFGGETQTETNYKGPDIVEIPLVNASYFVGFRGLRLDTRGFAISDFVSTSNGALDAFGGPALASKPYFNTPFDSLIPIRTGRGFTEIEIESLLDSGISILGNNPADNTIVSGEIVTTEKTDAAGNPDPTFKVLNSRDTAVEVREFFTNNYRSRFSQSRLTVGDVVKGREIANELVIRSFTMRLFQILRSSEFELLVDGEEALAFFEDNLFIVINPAEGEAVIQMITPIVPQLRNIIATMKVSFGAEIGA